MSNMCQVNGVIWTKYGVASKRVGRGVCIQRNNN